VAFSSDYPFGSMCAARAFPDNLPLTQADRERISHRNAEDLLGV
jgi:predicted TIM-barrel fold metal-dependent hydrolase